MALIEIRNLSGHTRLGLWRMDEPFDGTPRQWERRAVEMLIETMTGKQLVVDHEPSGKPVLEGWHVSISHTRGFAAVVLSDCEEVAVDIEYQSDRVGRIAERFIREDESVATIEEMLLLWSAKETLYKLFSADNLQFFEMRLCSMDQRAMLLENMKQKKIVGICFEITDDYVLTYTSLPTERL